jgi:hypothetical protein
MDYATSLHANTRHHHPNNQLSSHQNYQFNTNVNAPMGNKAMFMNAIQTLSNAASTTTHVFVPSKHVSSAVHDTTPKIDAKTMISTYQNRFVPSSSSSSSIYSIQTTHDKKSSIEMSNQSIPIQHTISSLTPKPITASTASMKESTPLHHASLFSMQNASLLSTSAKMMSETVWTHWKSQIITASNFLEQQGLIASIA